MEQKKKFDLRDYILDFSDIPYNRDFEERALLPFETLNRMVGGLELGEISLIAGETGSGKTTFVSQCVSKIIETDKVMCIYGESTIEKQASALFRQMTPYSKDNYYVKQYEKNGKKTEIAQWFISEEQEQRVRNKTKGRLFIYNTKGGMTMNKIINVIRIAHEENGINYFLIDNLMQIETLTDNEVKELKDDVELLRRYVIDNKIHLIIIAHYRKSQDYTMVRRRLEDVLGTSAIGNKCATAINVIRCDTIDRNCKGWTNLVALCKGNGYDITKDDCGSVIEVLKTRHNKLGFVALSYDKNTNTYSECKRISDFKEEVLVELPPKQTEFINELGW